MAGTSVYYLAAVEYLSDGQWHDWEKTLRRVMAAVPPGKAVQQAERSRIAQYKKTGKPPQARSKFTGDTDHMIRTGARTIARATLNNKGRFEKNADKTKIRLRDPEEIKARIAAGNRTKGKKSWETRLREQGIDPATHVTKEEQARRRRAEMATWTPEQWAAYHSTNSRKGWASRKAKEEYDRIQGLRGREGPGQRAQEPGSGWPGPGSDLQREGGDHGSPEEGARDCGGLY